ncbi:metallophosphoesterase [Bacillus sp. SM2101]|uniref:metallophosphoesterase n=1 Tax=Bacillus sp. SM2101 TaxID=2805366 RepID=UPI001BDF3900
MKRILAISDIHGCYDEFLKLLDKANYNLETDQLILLGDYEDRRLKSKDVINQIIDLQNNGAISLRGNHDQMFLDWLTSNDYFASLNFFRNGGFNTVTSYVGYNFFDEGYDEDRIEQAKNFIHKHFSHHIEFLKSLSYYHETEDCIFVHAGINPMLKDWKNSSHDFIWIREPFLSNPHRQTKSVIHGHTPCLHLHDKNDIYFGEMKVGIDGACAYGGQLNCLIIEDGEFSQVYVNKIIT